MTPEIDLTTLGTASVTAPAGHGKTEVIAATVAAHPEYRFLVLTHTNAGVDSLKQRIDRYAAGSKTHIETITALTLRLVRAFPTQIQWVEQTMSINYKAALVGATNILARPTVRDAFCSTYDRLIVDEYQDCTCRQDGLIRLLASQIPTVVLGDPLQAIFNMDATDPLVSWDEVQTFFHAKETLPIAHRWASTNPELGEWLKSIRTPLLAGSFPVLVNSKVVALVNLERPASQGGLFELFRNHETTVVIIGDSRKDHTISVIARVHSKAGARVHEAAQQKEFVQLCGSLASAESAVSQVKMVTDFLAACLTGVPSVAGFNTVMRNIKDRGNVGRSKTSFAQAVRIFIDCPFPGSMLLLVKAVMSAADGRIYRPEPLLLFKRALSSMPDGDWQELPLIARQLIDEASHVRHLRMQHLEVGSTLRVKGLEYDHVILLNPSEIPSREHLYVALSRAKRHITLAVSPGASLGKWLTY